MIRSFPPRGPIHQLDLAPFVMAPILLGAILAGVLAQLRGADVEAAVAPLLATCLTVQVLMIGDAWVYELRVRLRDRPAGTARASVLARSWGLVSGCLLGLAVACVALVLALAAFRAGARGVPVAIVAGVVGYAVLMGALHLGSLWASRAGVERE